MRTLLVRWAIIMIAVILVTWGLPQTGLISQPLMSYNNDWRTLAVFAAILALLNTFVRPVLALLSLPITCLTAGLFVIVINTIMFAVAAYITPNFQLTNIWGALVGALAVSVVGFAANFITQGT